MTTTNNTNTLRKIKNTDKKSDSVNSLDDLYEDEDEDEDDGEVEGGTKIFTDEYDASDDGLSALDDFGYPTDEDLPSEDTDI